MQLIIGNKNYSSWSMRPWVLARELAIPFEEVMLRFDFTPGSPFFTVLAGKNPAARVPVLVEDDGFCVWDSLAICEYLAERHPERPVWPADVRDRARARCLCAEMHSGFGALRNAFPMNIEAELSAVGARILAEQPKVASDLARIDAIFAAATGPFLFGAFGAADAFFAPVVMRVKSYGLPLSTAARAYADRVEQCVSVQTWMAAAIDEHDWVAEDEPYRPCPTGK